MKPADNYKIKLDVFEGPLDLLLHLIDKEEVDIYDIPIARITEQYVEYLEILRMLDLNLAGEFLVMAATLMQIKSRMLLPIEEQDGDNPDELDPRSELVARLLEYKKYKEAANDLEALSESREDVFTRSSDYTPAGEDEDQEESSFEVSLFDLITAFSKILSVVSEEIYHEVLEDEYTVGDKVIEISGLLLEQKNLNFNTLFKKARSKMEAITMFLALLELVKMQKVSVSQKFSGGDIDLSSKMERPGIVSEAQNSELPDDDLNQNNEAD